MLSEMGEEIFRMRASEKILFGFKNCGENFFEISKARKIFEVTLLRRKKDAEKKFSTVYVRRKNFYAVKFFTKKSR